MSPVLLFGLLAAVPAILAEYLYKTVQGPWINHIWLWLPIQLTIGYAIYRLVNLPGLSILDAFVVFAFGTALLRIIVSALILHQDIKAPTWVAFGLIITANVVRMFWRV